jgi:predicted nucleic acid-binding protein
MLQVFRRLRFFFSGKTVSHGNDTFHQRPGRAASRGPEKTSSSSRDTIGLSRCKRIHCADPENASLRASTSRARPYHRTDRHPGAEEWSDNHESGCSHSPGGLSVRYLLDINTLIALGHTAHVHHPRVVAWYRALPASTTALCTCAITELGFLRVAVQADLQPDVAAARKALAALKTSSMIPFEMLNDDLGADRLPAFAKTHPKLTDGHLFELARTHQAQLATLDRGIPGAALLL